MRPLRYEWRGNAGAKELLLYTVQDRLVSINTRVVGVLLYGVLMRCKVAGERADVVSGALERGVEVPGVSVGVSTGCARIAFAGSNPNRDGPPSLATATGLELWMLNADNLELEVS